MGSQVRRQSVGKAVTSWAEQLPSSYLQCRDIGHSWKPLAASWVPADRQYHRELQCGRCRALRAQRLSSTGYVESSWYVYPDDYLMPPGSTYDTAARAVVHLASVTQLIDRAQRRSA